MNRKYIKQFIREKKEIPVIGKILSYNNYLKKWYTNINIYKWYSIRVTVVTVKIVITVKNLEV